MVETNTNKVRWVYVALMTIPLAIGIVTLPLGAVQLWDDIQFLASSVFILVSVIALIHRGDQDNLRSMSVGEWGFIIFVILGFISASWAISPPAALFQAFAWLHFYLLFKVITAFRLTERELSHLGTFVMICLSISILIFVDKYLTDTQNIFTNNRWKIRIVKRTFQGFTNNDNTILAIWALSLCFVLPQTFKTLVGKIAKYAVILSTSYLIIVSTSQGAKVALICIILAFVISNLKQFWSLKKLVLAVACFAGVCFLIAMFQMNLIFSFISESQDMGSRYIMWKQSLNLWLSNPLFGIGMGNWPYEIYQYGIDQYTIVVGKRPFSHAHNLFIEVLAESGIIGLLGLVAFIFSPFFGVVELIRSFDPRRFAALILLTCFILLSFIYGITYHDFRKFAEPSILACFAYAILHSSDSKKTHRVPSEYIILGMAILTIVWFSFCYRQDRYIMDGFHIKDPDKRHEQYKKAIHPQLNTHFLNPKKNILDFVILDYYRNRKMHENVIETFETMLALDPYNITYLEKYYTYLGEKAKFHPKRKELKEKILKLNSRNRMLKVEDEENE